MGYWGDITISPFWTFGLTVDDINEYQKFYKLTNDKYYYYNEKISEYYVEKLIKDFTESLIDTNFTFKIIFERDFSKINKKKDI